MTEANEAPRAAARRELLEELGLAIEVGTLLYAEWVPPHDPWDDQLALIFDGGVLTDEEIARLRITDQELDSFAFVPVDLARARLRSARRHRRVERRGGLTLTCPTQPSWFTYQDLNGDNLLQGRIGTPDQDPQDTL